MMTGRRDILAIMWPSVIAISKELAYSIRASLVLNTFASNHTSDQITTSRAVDAEDEQEAPAKGIDQLASVALGMIWCRGQSVELE